MKKTLILSMIFMLTLGLSMSVFAADITATLGASSNKNTVSAGEELVVTLTLKDIANVSAGITNITTKINYDSNIFETITEQDIESAFLRVYNDNEGTHELTIATTTGIKLETEIAKITFKVKANVLNTTTNIQFKDTTVNESNAEAVSIADSEVAVQIGIEEIPSTTLSKIEITKAPTKTVYKIGEKFDKTGMEVKAIYSDNTTKIITDYTYAPMAELKETDEKITITYKDGTVTKTVEQKITVNETGTLPDAGTGNYAIAIIAILVVAVISFIKVKKYNNI